MFYYTFNFIIRGYDGVSGQLSRASSAVASSSSCDGLTIAVPTTPPLPTPTGGYQVNGHVIATIPPPTATIPPLHIFKCADLEPLMGGDTWQTIRAAMGPAIWVLFAYAELRRLRPHPTIGG